MARQQEKNLISQYIYIYIKSKTHQLKHLDLTSDQKPIIQKQFRNQK